MKLMIFLLSILTIFSSCEEEVVTPNFLPGSWNLNKTELFVEGSLQGSSVYEEITTVYQFNNCENETDNDCELYILEDGESNLYNYSYNQNTGILVLDSTNIYLVEFITESELILSKEYGENKSIWSFIKEG